jgi:hypothetical protein
VESVQKVDGLHKLGQLRNKLVVAYIRKVTNSALAASSSAERREAIGDMVKAYSEELMGVLNLLSGENRYVKQQCGVIITANELHDEIRTILPSLVVIYSAIDDDMKEAVSNLKRHFDSEASPPNRAKQKSEQA